MDHAERDRQEPVEPGPAAAAGPGSDEQPGERDSGCALGSTLSSELPLAVPGAEQVARLRLRLLESLALRRARRGSVAKYGAHYYEHGFPMAGYLTDTLDNLADAGMLALADEDQWRLRRVHLTETGQARYAELCDTPRRATAATSATTPAGCQPSCPEPLPMAGGQPDFTTLKSTVEQLRWARDPTDGHLHLLTPAAVTAATSQDHAHALCAQPIPAHYLAVTYGSPTSLCAACLAGICIATPEPGPSDTPPLDRRLAAG